jgi:anhydro-N-acetylmuramic acid kinase
MNPHSSFYIGLMSGTSLDGVDGVLVDCSATPLRVLAHASRGFDAALRNELLALNTPGDNELHRAALAGNALARLYAQVVSDLLGDAQLPTSRVQAIGAHGQTVRHRPELGYTTQLLNGALLAELTGIDVVCDLRSRDVAAKGQGAPLVPAFHQAVFAQKNETVVVLNVGGISNASILSDAGTGGFDCGPGNVLMDAWCQLHTGQPFDNAGQWAASGAVIPELLTRFLAEPYLTLPPPKSTGRDLFHMPWLQAQLNALPACAPQDVQRTLLEFTARCCVDSITCYLINSDQPLHWLVCGGGAFNTLLMQRLQELLPCPVLSTQTKGLPPMQVEAAAFAWLARAHVLRKHGNLAAVTGAQGARVLGCLYPAFHPA